MDFVLHLRKSVKYKQGRKWLTKKEDFLVKVAAIGETHARGKAPKNCEIINVLSKDKALF